MHIGPIQNSKSWKQEALKQIGERTLVCSVSGGKDSTAMALLFKELDIPFRSIFIDTGWEHKTTLEYVTQYLPRFIGPIKVLRNPKGGMVELIKKKGLFPRQSMRWCTSELKLQPMKLFVETLAAEPVSAVGIRAEESRKRATYPEWEYSSMLRCDIWRPIMSWTEQHVIDIIRRHGLRPNPLYLLGSNRVGCWPCIYASKRSIRVLAENDPQRVKKLRVLEQQLSKTQGRTHTWFRIGKKSAPIDDVIHWARNSTSKSEPFLPNDREQGCMKWGLCELEHPVQAQRRIIREK